MKILRESMTRVETKRFVVRVWRQEPDLATLADNKDMTELIQELAEEFLHPVFLAEKILKLERVNAVEVLDGRGQGEVLYANWP